MMKSPAVSAFLVALLALTATLIYAGGSRDPDGDTPTTLNMTRVHNQCSRQDLLDTRMTERDARLNGLDTRLSTQLNELQAQLNSLDTRLSAQLNTRQSEVNSRLNRMDSRLDGIETAISDMKGFLQSRMEAMDKKMEWALTDKPLQDDTGRTEPRVYTGCEDALRRGANISGVYPISPDSDNSFDVYCEQSLDQGGWTVFQARHNGKVDFYNDWNTYKIGFGEFMTEFWLGNDKIYTLTKHHNMQLKVELTGPEGEVQFADYRQFWIDDEAHQYKLYIAGYTGGTIPGDALSPHNGSRFSTKDNDNDKHPSATCATAYTGAWWYNACHSSNLNGLYGGTNNKGMRWSKWKGSLSMKATRMMMRRHP